MSYETQEQAPPPYHAEEEQQEEETMINQYNPAGLPVPTEHDLKQVHSSPSTGSARRMMVRRKKRKDDSLSDVIRSWLVEHQIGLSLNLLILHALAHIFFPRLRTRTRAFFRLSYYDTDASAYRRGPDDLYFVAYWTIIFTGLRAGVMAYVLLPWAQRAGLRTNKAKTRFAEQAWLLIYDSCSSGLGLYIMYNSPYWLNLAELWTDFPNIHISGVMKWYYLVQFAFWLQQIVVVNIEERRKDHWQMFSHHIITCALILMSFGFYQTRIGNVILLLMDVVDIFLEGAKVLKYSGYTTACDIAFTVFILAWFFFRHILYNLVCLSIYRDVPTHMPYGRYSSQSGTYLSPSTSHNPSDPAHPDGGKEILYNVLQPYLRPGGDVFYNSRIRIAFVTLLMALQVLCVVWFVMILRVAWRVVKGKGAEDVRSDDEDEDEEEEEFGPEDEWGEEGLGLHKPQVTDLRAAATGEVNVNVNVRRATPTSQKSLGASMGTGVGKSGGGSMGVRRRPSPMSKRKGGAGMGTGGGVGLSLADRKDLLGRIGCERPS